MKKFSHIVTEDDAQEKLPVRRLIRRYFNFSSRLRGKIKRENLVFINGKPVAGRKPGAKISIPLQVSGKASVKVYMNKVFIEDVDLN